MQLPRMLSLSNRLHSHCCHFPGGVTHPAAVLWLSSSSSYSCPHCRNPQSSVHSSPPAEPRPVISRAFTLLKPSAPDTDSQSSATLPVPDAQLEPLAPVPHPRESARLISRHGIHCRSLQLRYSKSCRFIVLPVNWELLEPSSSADGLGSCRMLTGRSTVSCA